MSNWIKALLLCALLLSACQPTPAAPSASPAQVLAVTNGALWDGSRLITAGTLLIRDGRILAAGAATEVAIPDGAQVIDAGGGTILPGLIDDHVHNAAEPEIRQQFLEAGVTTVCDAGAGAQQLRLYRSEQAPAEPIARGYYAGPFLSAPGGYPADSDASARREIHNVDEARAAVQDLAALGASYVMVALDDGRGEEALPVLSSEVLQAIVAEAHRLGLSVRAHVLDEAYLDMALEAGVDAIEHIPAPQLSRAEFEAWIGSDGALALPQTYLDRLQRLADSGVPLTPTLEVLERRTCNLVAQSEEERNACVRVYLEAVRQFRQMGGTIALGNDYGSAGMPTGLPWREMEFLREAGLSNGELLTAATTTAARVCGHGEELGALRPGYVADVLIVDGNPIEDLSALQRVKIVILAGQVVEED